MVRAAFPADGRGFKDTQIFTDLMSVWLLVATIISVNLRMFNQRELAGKKWYEQLVPADGR